MGLLDMCCPKKPKKSLDYVIKWAEDKDKTIKDLSNTVQELNKWKEDISEETLRTIFDEYAETYPWDNVPAFNAKADKVENAVAGNIASLDSEGNLQDSGKKPANFAPAVHSHSVILDASTESSISIDEGIISIEIEREGSGGETEINASNIGNLHRALEKPDTTPTSGSAKLVTSGGVYTAISKKSDKEFCDKVYSRLMEFEKKSSVEYGITATYSYIGSYTKPHLKIGENNIIYDYDLNSKKIIILYNVPYLYGLAFAGDVLVIKDLTTGTSLGTATVENLTTGSNAMILSGLSLPNDVSYNNKSIEIAITHGN